MQAANSYYSPTNGPVSHRKLRELVLDFLAENPKATYDLVVGSDSQVRFGEGVEYISAIVVHRKGHGGIYFWRRLHKDTIPTLRNRIYEEALMSLSCAGEVLTLFKDDGITAYDLEIHVDVGKKGATRELIQEVVGMVRGSGFAVKTKPDAYAASAVADRHT